MEEVKKNTVQQGEKAEVIFQHICLVKHNYMLSKPIGTTDYDLVVEVGKKLLKVQVKSTGNQNGSIRVCKGRYSANSKKVPYPKDLDFFACYFRHTNEWFIIPRNVTEDQVNLRVAQKRGNAKYYRYKDNWKFNSSDLTL